MKELDVLHLYTQKTLYCSISPKPGVCLRAVDVQSDCAYDASTLRMKLCSRHLPDLDRTSLPRNPNTNSILSLSIRIPEDIRSILGKWRESSFMLSARGQPSGAQEAVEVDHSVAVGARHLLPQLA